MTVTAITARAARSSPSGCVPPVRTRRLAPRAGQYLTLRLRPDGPDEPAVVRTYSLSAIDGRRRIPDQRQARAGRQGKRVSPGARQAPATRSTRPPRAGLRAARQRRPVALISAGVGATPVLAMLRTLANAHDARQVWWIHGARNGQEHAFGREVDGLLAGLPNGHRIAAYSRPGADDVLGAGFDRRGGSRSRRSRAAEIPADADYYICGPTGFMRELSAGLAAGGVPEHGSQWRCSGPSRRAGMAGARDRAGSPSARGPPGQGPVVTFSRSNLRSAWDPSYSSLLEFAEACDVPVSFGCRIGVCHNCESGLRRRRGRRTTSNRWSGREEGRVLRVLHRARR